ncbi:MAG: Homoserine O-acetyltransferase [Syntrophus sp. SKADARSKE-3]|nr:Homoserine O-acetyltransferase [Syntrophus sp. SKADARSKE-3]
MKRRLILVTAVLVTFVFFSTVSFGLDQIVEKKTFHLKELTLVSGKKLAPVQVGYETYGTLAPTKDNVILICHFYSGTSHAAGKYAAEDKAPGYWDAIIGPGKPFDTNKYFIVSSDTLVNVNTNDPKVVTTGPASINPNTGKPYGMSFPIVTIRDYVNVQYELLKFLGIKKLKAVSGASGGGLQTFQWAVSYPDFMERIIPVIATPKTHPWLIGWLKLWGDPIKMDPNWNKGDYYGKEAPRNGAAYALMLGTQSIMWEGWAEKSFDRKWADPTKNPFDAMENEFMVDAALYKAALRRLATADPNSMLYMNKACTLFDIGQGFKSYEDAVKTIKAKVLMIGADTDILFPASQIKSHADAFKKAGIDVSYFEIKSGFGHLGGLLAITQASETISKFMEK